MNNTFVYFQISRQSGNLCGINVIRYHCVSLAEYNISWNQRNLLLKSGMPGLVNSTTQKKNNQWLLNKLSEQSMWSESEG